MNEFENISLHPDEETKLGHEFNRHTQLTDNVAEDCTDDFMQIQRIFDEKYHLDD